MSKKSMTRQRLHQKKTTQKSRRKQSILNQIFKISWLTIGSISLVYALIQFIRGLSFNLSTAFLGGIGIVMLMLFTLSKFFKVTAARFFESKLFLVLKYCYTFFLMLFLVIGLLIFATSLHKPFNKVDYLIVLGAKVNQNNLSLSLKNRLDRALEYIVVYPDTPVILCGGQGSDEPMTEALAMERYILNTTKNKENVLLIREDASSNTIENLKNAAQIISHRENGIDANAIKTSVNTLIVTSDFHVFRTKMLATRVGLNTDVLPAETPLYVYPGLFVREIFAVFKSFIFDWV